MVTFRIARLQSLGSDGSELKWNEGFNIGSVIEAKIGEAKDIGVVVSFDKYNDVLGFITHSQCGLSLETGSVVQVAVLDVDKAERLVDLSLKSEFVEKSQEGSSKSQTHKKKRKREASKALELHQTINAVVEIVKEHYLIARLQSLGSDGSELKWIEGFNIGSVIEAKIGEAKDIGVVVSFDKYNDVLGFITFSQLMHLLGYIIEGCCHH